MYLSHFILENRPFAISPDPEYLLWTTQHKAAYQELLKQLPPKKSVIVFSGEIGCGKTTLLLALLQSVEVQDHWNVIRVNSQLSSESEVSQHILSGLGNAPPDYSNDKLHSLVMEKLGAIALNGKLPVLIIDDAHLLSIDAARTLATIAKGTRGKSKLFLLILVGQPSLNVLVAQPALSSLRESIARTVWLEKLSADEIADFIHFRLQRAGLKGNTLFTPDAIEAIYAYTLGTPTLINKLCEQALYCGAEKGLQKIDENIIREVLEGWNPSRRLEDYKSSIEMTLNGDGDGTVADANSSKAATLPKPLGQAEFLGATTSTLNKRQNTNSIQQPEKPLRITKWPASNNTLDYPIHLEQNDTPRGHRLSKIISGGLIAVACTVSALLLLNKFNDRPSQSNTNEFPSQSTIVRKNSTTVTATEIEADTRRASGAISTVDGVEKAAENPPRPDQRAATIQGSEQQLAELAKRIAASETEERQLVDNLKNQQEKQRAISLLVAASTVERTRVESQVTQLTNNVKALERQIEKQQVNLSKLVEETATAEINLAKQQTDQKNPIRMPSEIEKVARSTVTALGNGTFYGEQLIPVAAQIDPPSELQPLFAKNGDPVAFYSAALTSTGPQDMAVNYTLAALRGHARSALYLGQLFDTGDGLLFDAEMAKRWYSVADETARLHSPELAKLKVEADLQSVYPLTAVVTEEIADFIWQGKASLFRLELAGQNEKLVAFAQTPLSAINVSLPSNAVFWRVTTDGGSSFDWQPIRRSNK